MIRMEREEGEVVRCAYDLEGFCTVGNIFLNKQTLTRHKHARSQCGVCGAWNPVRLRGRGRPGKGPPNDADVRVCEQCRVDNSRALWMAHDASVQRKAMEEDRRTAARALEEAETRKKLQFLERQLRESRAEGTYGFEGASRVTPIRRSARIEAAAPCVARPVPATGRMARPCYLAQPQGTAGTGDGSDRVVGPPVVKAISKLGSGGQGSVYMAKYYAGNVALKVAVKVADNRSAASGALFRETCVIERLKASDHVVNSYGRCMVDLGPIGDEPPATGLALMLELLPLDVRQVWSGSVPADAAHILRYTPPCLSPDLAAGFIGWMAGQLHHALRGLVACRTAHGDIHTSNIMFKASSGVVRRYEDLVLVLVDFGMSKKATGSNLDGGCRFYSLSSFCPTLTAQAALNGRGVRCCDCDRFSALQVLFQLMAYHNGEAREVARNMRSSHGVGNDYLKNYMRRMGTLWMEEAPSQSWLDFVYKHRPGVCVEKVHMTYCTAVRRMLNKLVDTSCSEPGTTTCAADGVRKTETLYELLKRLLDVRLAGHPPTDRRSTMMIHVRKRQKKMAPSPVT